MSVFDHIEFDNHEHVAFYHDKEAGLSAIIAIHNTNLGPALGGCRMWPYVSSAEALTDVLRLSKGMTYKAAMANIALGGGKSVIIGDPRKQKTPAMMEAMGKFVDSLGGKYFTAEDSGISVTDLQTMATQSDYIAGVNAQYHYADEQPDGNPAPSTAYGVFVGLRASVEHGLNRSLEGVSVAIQGMGHVGYRLASHLHAAGAKLYVADIFPEGVEKAVAELGATAVAPEEILGLDVDVLAPCALGAAINDQTLPMIKAKVIAGAANNQLAREEIGDMLVERGILYAPDYVINAGGIIDIFHQRMEKSTNAALRKHIEDIGTTLKEIYTRADAQKAATNRVANIIAEERFSLKD
ncbi:Leucine dehydrogenase [Alteromonas sp. 38]|uniref:Glu/Leu/Phe/Val dehydrogenase dimerization domain-containing protein n=1 Tax=unclassified Alteromonas TaxID=2614992 RepID=UPI0012F01580|nr:MULTISPECIES: Glu/Leu/Phe/Val dehydrogenase dimerization domain-containing protein [unclassified Alteromonas]CAD5285132.1 Leucine dehydrogenase [Alteromonas sp. 154]VXB39350.1 Leucine dehydrogenase [Alteromonas sp. 38]